jgi:FtsP/CotA-like multicopper oxidase with cupredoxin domain
MMHRSTTAALIRLAIVLAPVVALGQTAMQLSSARGGGAPPGPARQDVFPYAGQCWTAAPIPGRLDIPQCTLANAKSFACEPSGSGFSNQSAGTPGNCGAVTQAKLLNPVDPATQAKFQFEVLNPVDYTPDQTKFTGADYYEIAVHESWGFQSVASAGLFPDPTKFACGAGTCAPVPNGQQWTGLVCPATSANCTAGQPIYTPIWGVGQRNMKGGPVTSVLSSLKLFTPATTSPEWSKDNFVATWPSISIRGTTGRPVVVKWVNEFPNNHLFCPHPEAADWPCAIDRTFMGVKASIDPATAPLTFQLAGVPYNGVNQFGGPQQPDNSWVTHLHGGEIPPQVDGFAEKWFGNARTGSLYSPQPWLLSPAFNSPAGALPNKQVGNQYGAIFRPGGDPKASGGAGESSWMYDTYTYPMVNEESTIWFHTHTLGKTHHDVIAGPAGFFPVKDPSKHHKVVKGVCATAGATDCEYTWLDPLTEPRNALGVPLYDLFLAVQDRAFNDDGSLNFPNGLAEPLPAPVAAPTALQNPAAWPNPVQLGAALAPGVSPLTPGPNPQVHPVWVPEYFADHGLVNGVLWPKKTVAPGWYRVRLVDGSDARCYNLTFGTAQGTASGLGLASRGLGQQGPGESGIQVTVIATEQGYLKAPLVTDHVTMCPGERYEFLIDFSAYAGQSIYVNNNAAGPFPDGVTPQDPLSPFSELATIMRFDVAAAATAATGPAVPSCGAGSLTWDPALTPAQNGVACVAVQGVIDHDFVDLRSTVVAAPACPGQAGACVAAERVLFLSEKVDGVTGSSLGLQINGMPFEYDVTETPKKGTFETWHIVNTTVDAHPMHPHLGKYQIVKREAVDVGCYRTLLCGTPTCTPGAAPGGIPAVTPDYQACLKPSVAAYPVDPEESGWKDAMRAYPGEVLTFVGKWDGSWNPQVAAPNVPGAGNARNPGFTTYPVGANSPGNVRNWTYPDVTSGPYVWHCHINSHEDSEMMRSSLVVK